MSLATDRSVPHGKDGQFVTALARGLDILACFTASRPEIGGTQLAAMTGLPQPTVWRLCHTMVRLGYLVPAGGDRFRPGLPILKLGRAALASIPLATDALEGMRALADRFGSACGLGARDDGRIVLVQSYLSQAQLVMNLRVSARLSLMTSGLGWGFLAGHEEVEREALIAQYAASDPHWPDAEPEFRRAMAGYMTQGYILNIGVFHKGYNTAAVPILGADGKPAFAVSCAGSSATHPPGLLRRQIGPKLRSLATLLQVVA